MTKWFDLKNHDGGQAMQMQSLFPVTFMNREVLVELNDCRSIYLEIALMERWNAWNIEVEHTLVCGDFRIVAQAYLEGIEGKVIISNPEAKAKSRVEISFENIFRRTYEPQIRKSKKCKLESDGLKGNENQGFPIECQLFGAPKPTAV